MLYLYCMFLLYVFYLGVGFSNFFCYSFLGFAYVYCMVHQSVLLVVFCFVFRLKSAFQFFVFVNLSNVLQLFVMYLNLRVYLFVFIHFCCYCVVTSSYFPLYRSFSQLFVLIFQVFG